MCVDGRCGHFTKPEDEVGMRVVSLAGMLAMIAVQSGQHEGVNRVMAAPEIPDIGEVKPTDSFIEVNVPNVEDKEFFPTLDVDIVLGPKRYVNEPHNFRGIQTAYMFPNGMAGSVVVYSDDSMPDASAKMYYPTKYAEHVGHMPNEKVLS